MGAISLWSSLEVPDPILQIGQSARVGVTPFDGHCVELSRSTNQCWVGDVMLSDKERSFGTFLANESIARPAPEFSDDRHKAITIATMYGPHVWVVPLRQLAGLGEALTNGQVFAGQALEFISEVGSLHQAESSGDDPRVGLSALVQGSS